MRIHRVAGLRAGHSHFWEQFTLKRIPLRISIDQMRFCSPVYPFAVEHRPAQLWLACLLALNAAAQPLVTDCPYAVQTWRMEDGLPENRVRSVIQTRDGYVWVATFNGLARFDGVDFRVYDTVKTPELRDCAIRVLFEDSRGVLWLGHHNGQLTTYAAGHFTTVSPLEGWPNLEVDSLGEDREGQVWVMNRDGWLAGFKEGRAEALVQPMSEHLVNHLHAGAFGALWVHRDFEVLAFLPKEKRSDKTSQAIRARASMVACPSRAGGFWVADTGLRRWHDGQWVEDRGPLPWEDPGLTALMETATGDVWVGTYTKGIYVAGRSGFRQQVDVGSGLSHNTVSCFWEDREGNVWVGTGGGGLNRLRQKRVRMVGPPDQWRNHPVLCVATNRSGGLWVGTEGSGVYAFDQREWRNYDDRRGILRRDVWSVHEDRIGAIWVGSARQGVLKMEGDRFVPAPGWPERSWIIYALLEGEAGDLWVGAERGVGRLSAGSWQMIDLDPAVVEERVRHIAVDRSGTVWFATAGNGLWRLQDGRRTRFGRTEGLTSEYLTSLHVDSEQTLWIGTKGGGLWRHRDGRFAAVTTKHGLPGDTVMSIIDDAAGYLWLGTFQGLVRVSPDELNRCADGRLDTINCLQLDLTDGLKSLEFEGPNQPNACRTADGRLWFATAAGLAMVDPRTIYTNVLAPPVMIESLVVDGQAVQMSGIDVQPPARTATDGKSLSSHPTVIPAGKRRFELRYAGLSYAAPQRMRFRHRLEGLENQWVEAGRARAAYYSYLAPGGYTFHVKACNNDGVWNETGAALSFRVLPHYWQTWWFRVGSRLAGAAGLVGAVATFLRRRHRRRLEGLEHQGAVQRERMRIAQDIHDDLGAHLTRISLLSESAQNRLRGQPAAVSEIDRIHQTAHDLTCALDEIVWAVNPRHDTLNSLVNYLINYAEEFVEPASVRMRLEVPLSLPAWPLPADVRHNLFLAAKEALHNVLKHARATEVVLSVELTATGFTLGLADNGRGFEPASGGNGLWSMAKRLQDIGGVCQVHSVPGQGTRITFSVSLKPSSLAGLSRAASLSPK